MRIGIVGLGLIGGSLGMALRRLGRSIEVVGLTRTAEAAGPARQLGAVDHASPDLAILDGCDLIVVATPIDQIGEVIEQVASLTLSGTAITDVASVKRPVRQWARRLPEPGLLLGGHPVAGKTENGLEAADPALFRGEPWIFTPFEAQSLRPFDGWLNLVEAIGARPAFLSPEEHDRQMAYLSHLAFVASAAFAKTVRSHADASLGGPGYRGMSRLAGGDASMYASILRDNSESTLEAIDAFSATMAILRERIAGGKPLGDLFETSHVAV
jgi:prephenate dehydrogenase